MVQGSQETKPTPYVILEAFLQFACRLNSQRGLPDAQMTLERKNIDNVISSPEIFDAIERIRVTKVFDLTPGQTCKLKVWLFRNCVEFSG
jgi:hypothetical protein